MVNLRGPRLEALRETSLSAESPGSTTSERAPLLLAPAGGLPALRPPFVARPRPGLAPAAFAQSVSLESSDAQPPTRATTLDSEDGFGLTTDSEEARNSAAASLAADPSIATVRTSEELPDLDEEEEEEEEAAVALVRKPSAPAAVRRDTFRKSRARRPAPSDPVQLQLEPDAGPPPLPPPPSFAARKRHTHPSLQPPSGSPYLARKWHSHQPTVGPRPEAEATSEDESPASRRPSSAWLRKHRRRRSDSDDDDDAAGGGPKPRPATQRAATAPPPSGGPPQPRQGPSPPRSTPTDSLPASLVRLDRRLSNPGNKKGTPCTPVVLRSCCVHPLYPLLCTAFGPQPSAALVVHGSPHAT